MTYKSQLNRITLIISLQLCLSWQVFSQNIDEIEPSQTDELSNYYTTFSLASSNTVFRDYATSPLFYEGVGIALNSAWLRRSDQQERLFLLGFGFIPTTARVPKSDFIQSGSTTMYSNVSIYYHRLWKLETLSDSKNNIKVGGAVNMTQNIRSNSDLHNNALGLENLSNVMGTAQFTRDISRRESKTLDFFLFKTTLKPVKKDIRLLLNVGVLNFNFRPGYAYAYNSEIDGIETDALSWALSNYKWSLNGWRLNTQLEFISYLPNGNARSFSYVWDAAHAPGKHEDFQMASHRFQFTYYFHTKKR